MGFSKIKEFIESKFNSPKRKTFEGYYNAGVDSYAKQDYHSALKHFMLAIEQEGVRSQVYYNLGLTYQCLKEYERAISAYSKFLEANPEDYDGLYNIALTYFDKKDYKNAIEYFKKCVEMKNEDDVIKALVLAYLSNDEVQPAVKLAQNIFETRENGLDLYYEIAKIFESKNPTGRDFTLIDEAIDMYLNVISKDSTYFDAYLSVSICYAKRGEWEDSVEFCKKALKLNPDSYEANNQIGLVYYCCDEIKKAVIYYEIALKLKPKGDYKAYSNLAYAYEKMLQYEKAIKIFTQLLKKFPEFPAKEEIKNHLRVLKTL